MQVVIGSGVFVADGEPIKLPENLESLPKADHFPTQRHRWNTNEEIAAILISFERHNEWQSKEVKIRPKSGSMLLYSRKKVRYRRDGYCWKKRKDGKTTREDHMKLKVQGTECIYGCYVHSAILPTFHRRCYWLLQNPDIVLVHYLNVPYPDDNKLAVITPSLALWGDKKEWTKEELVSQLKPMCESAAPSSYSSVQVFSEDEPDLNNELEISTAETVEAIVTQLMEKQRVARAAALTKQLECGCPDSTCADSKTCSHPMRRISAATLSSESSNQVSSTTGSGSMILTAAATGNAASIAGSSVTGTGTGTLQQAQARLHHHGHHSAASTSSSSTTTSTAAATPPLVLSLSQIQGGGGLLILNSSSSGSSSSAHQSLVSPESKQSTATAIVIKQEAMETSSSSNNNNINNNHGSSKMDVTNGNITTAFDTGGTTYLTSTRDKNVLRQTSKQHISLSNSASVMSSAPPTPTKHMDTSNDDLLDIKPTYCGSDTVLVIGSSSSSCAKSTDTVSFVGGFFNETLDLSQEDIQRTLSANMPLSSSKSLAPSNSDEIPADDVIVSEINPMEFIDICDVVVSPTQVDDDVFVNLDAFDMLGDFPELEVLEPSTVAPGSSVESGGFMHMVESPPVSNQGAGGGSGESSQASGKTAPPADSSGSTGSSVEKGNEQSSPRMDYREGTANITDYSPEWAYPEGGVKVLVTGPWYSTTSPYTVLFDTFPVPTTLVQSGVLRCYCPAHEVGLATLQVACEGFVISNSVIFEYKKPPREDRVPACEPRLEKSSDNLLKFTLLQRLEAMDDRLQIKQEPSGSDLVEGSSLLNMINFEDRLVSYCQEMTTRAWRSTEDISSSLSASYHGMTLLHLAASLGYTRLVCAMLHWRSENSSLLLETEVDALSQDEDGFTPLMWACAKGHRETAVLLYRWNHTALNVRNHAAQMATDCARSNRHEELALEMERLEASREKANMMIGSESAVITPVPSPASSVMSLTSVASTSQSHDGVFLHPGAVTRSESQKYKVLSVELHVNIPSSENSASSPMATSSHSSSPSPVRSVSGAIDSSNTLSNSVTVPQSHQRLVKRPSVDSGIHLASVQSSDSLPTLRSRSSKMQSGRETPKLSRFDRSMSLPLNSPMSGMDCSYDGNSSDTRDMLRSSPVRRMDFALCEVATGPRSESPIIDVEGVSDEELDGKQSVVGEQEVRVLTLAEQIIAAMPDRIKNESEDMLLGHDCSPQPDSSNGTSDSLSEVFMEPLLLDETPSTYEPVEFNFEFSDHNYRYYDVGTPSSSLSPASSSCLQSPCSFTLDSPSPPPTTADFCEFFQASSSLFEKDFSNLTLSDREQRELYEAAKIIQKAYRSYKGRKKLEEQDKERAAAVLIQNYYRRYKQYAYFKQMTRAATVIQNGYRSYCEHKRFKKSQEAAVCIQNYYRNYREQGGRGSREGTPTATSSGLKRTYSQRRQHQAARKIQQFMRQSKNKLQRERALAAERERQVVLSVDAPPRLLCPDSLDCCSIDLSSSAGGTMLATSSRHNERNSIDASEKT
ncbi:calmodulin-binding transcription activator 2 [Anabrus simplex]|uniref:calmodulin-binding transcription activator 2 n=1 Tax=Anabrus simplex TaxID=316456 RepID=UPI0035A3AD8A